MASVLCFPGNSFTTPQSRGGMEELGLAAWPVLLPREGWAMSPHEGKQMSVNSQKTPSSWGEMGPIPGDGSTGAVLEWEVAQPLQEPPLLCSDSQQCLLQGTGQDRIPRLMRTGSPTALTLWEMQLSFHMKESEIGNEWKMNFFQGCLWLEEGGWTGRPSADYMLYVYQEENLLKCAGADVMVTNHTCCLNKVWISNCCSVWQYLGLNFPCFRGGNFEVHPHMQDFSPIREVWSGALVCWEHNKCIVSVRQKREQCSDA